MIRHIFKKAFITRQKQTCTFDQINRLTGPLDDLKELEALSFDIDDEIDQIHKKFIASHFSIPCFLELKSGSGGLEANDFMDMLANMYEKYLTNNKIAFKVVERDAKSVVLSLDTNILHYETGIHRLVRISPFSSQGKRHTSFVSIQVLPVQEKGLASYKQVELDPNDLKIAVMRAQGAGGQHVNKTESAVRITHIPTGIAVLCQQERSQHQNKQMAMLWLKSKLFNKAAKEAREQKQETYSGLGDIAFGHQIRNYVMHPYQMVKDTRSGYMRKDMIKVLDGDIHDFLVESWIVARNELEKK